MESDFLTRNEARSILVSIANQCNSNSISIQEITTYTALWYMKRKSTAYTKFVFTSAMVDMFTGLNAVNESNVDFSMILKNDLTFDQINQYIRTNWKFSIEECLNRTTREELDFQVRMSAFGATELNRDWFNDADRFIHPLLASYQNFKLERDMPLKNDDIQQIPIDYSVALCYNHYKQVGFLNVFVCSAIVRLLTAATNACTKPNPIESKNIEKIVLKDLSNPKMVKAAIDFINRL